MDLLERSIGKEYFQDLKQRTNHNYIISDFYRDFFEATGDFSRRGRAVRIRLSAWGRRGICSVSGR